MKYLCLALLLFCRIGVAVGQQKYSNDRLYISSYGGLRLSAVSETDYNNDLELAYNQTSYFGLNAGGVIFKKFILKASFQYNVESFSIYHKEGFYDGYEFYDNSGSVRVLEAGKEYFKFRNELVEAGLGIGYQWRYKTFSFAPFASVQWVFKNNFDKHVRTGKEMGTNNIRTWTTALEPPDREFFWSAGVDFRLKLLDNFGLFSSVGYVNSKSNVVYSVATTDILYAPAFKNYPIRLDKRGLMISLGLFISFFDSGADIHL